MDKRAKLNSLVTEYSANKGLFEEYKKLCDAENATIKDLMLELELPEVQVGSIIAKRIVQVRESMNMDRLLVLIKKSNLPDDVKNYVVRTREYVDMDALEDAIYNGDVSAELLLDMDTCKETKEVVTLKLSKAKKPKEEE